MHVSKKPRNNLHNILFILAVNALFGFTSIDAKGGTYPAWSPDGKYIVFTRNNFPEFGDENGRL